MKKNLTVAAAAMFVMIIVMQWQGAELKTTTSKLGIVNLEFADTPVLLHNLLSRWDIGVVKMNIWLDFLFIISYTLFFAIASAYCAMKWAEKSWPRQIGFFLARVAFAAGIFDIAENLLMLQSIAGNYTDASLNLTFYCAAIKFLLLGLVIVYLILSLPNTLSKK
ncbi:MAG: hypothetical protein V4450_11075 [Bacteroidota bacterium]